MSQHGSLFGHTKPIWQILDALKNSSANWDETALSQLRHTAKQALSQFELDALADKSEPRVLFYAKFALIALIDEWVIRHVRSAEQWFSYPLQLELMGENNAGEQFYIYLAELRLQCEVNRAVLELYYHCLMLGFQGKYAHQPQNDRQRLCIELASQIQPVNNQAISLSQYPHAARTTCCDKSNGHRRLAFFCLSAVTGLYCILQGLTFFSQKSHRDDMETHYGTLVKQRHIPGSKQV